MQEWPAHSPKVKADSCLQVRHQLWWVFALSGILLFFCK